MRLRVIGAFSLRCKGAMALSLSYRATAAQLDRINIVNPTRSSGCRFSSV
jgi:hypothetical protein